MGYYINMHDSEQDMNTKKVLQFIMHRELKQSKQSQAHHYQPIYIRDGVI